MPNSANRSNKNNSSKGQGDATQPASHESTPKPNPERSDLKHGSGEGTKGDPGRTSNQGRKAASGGS